MHRPSSAIPADLTLAREPSAGDGPRWVVAQAEAELLARYGFLDENERSLMPAVFDPPTGAFVMARAGAAGPPVGGVGMRSVDQKTAVGQSRDGRRWGEVRRLWVDPNQRGQGVARRLMVSAEEVAVDLGLTDLGLVTGPRQPEAVALYEATGWTPDPLNSATYGFRFTKNLVALR